jgi:hypothetical protein
MRNTGYQIISKNDSRKLADFLCRQGQMLLPMVELITQARMAIDELIDVTGLAFAEKAKATTLKLIYPLIRRFWETQRWAKELRIS